MHRAPPPPLREDEAKGCETLTSIGFTSASFWISVSLKSFGGDPNSQPDSGSLKFSPGFFILYLTSCNPNPSSQSPSSSVRFPCSRLQQVQPPATSFRQRLPQAGLFRCLILLFRASSRTCCLVPCHSSSGGSIASIGALPPAILL